MRLIGALAKQLSRLKRLRQSLGSRDDDCKERVKKLVFKHGQKQLCTCIILFSTFLTSTARLVRMQGRWSWGRGALDTPPSHFSRGKMFCFSIIKVHAVSTRRTCYFRPYPGWVYVKNTISEPLVFTGPVWTQYRLHFCTARCGCMAAWQHSWKTSFWTHSRPQSHSA